MTDSKNAFVIMPFSATATCTEAQWTDVYENVFKSALEECGYACERAQPMIGSLTRSIVERLRFSTIVLADLTDRNPNVFYELGIRHSLSKRTIVVAQGGEHVPSDLRGYWFMEYGTRPGQVTQFKKEIRRLVTEIEKDPDRSDNPVADYLDQEQRSISSFVDRENIKKLGALYTELTGNIVSLTNAMRHPDAPVDISYEGLNLFLHTMYVDPGPQLLQTAYALQQSLRQIARGERKSAVINRTLLLLQTLSSELTALRRNLVRGDYQEPTTISLMTWKCDISCKFCADGSLDLPIPSTQR